MNKKLLAVALATAFAAPAMAEGVQIYGAIDYGVLVRGGSDGGLPSSSGTKSQFEDGISGENFLGFKGSEDLGNGMQLGFDAQFRFSADTSTAFYTRTANVTLSGDFGTLIGGRVGGARYSFTNMYDPFGGYTVGGAAGFIGGQADVADNAIVYITPELAPGLKILAAYTSSLDQEDMAGIDQNRKGSLLTSSDRPLYAVAALYNNGPLSITLDYENARKYNTSLYQTLNIYVAGASYDFGVAKLSAYYENLDFNGGPLKSYNSFLLGALAPVSANTNIRASFVQTEVGNGLSALLADGECRKYSLGLTHAISKRTTFYTDVAKIDNDTNTACSITKNGHRDNPATVGTSAVQVGTLEQDGGVAGRGSWGFDAGIRHTF